MSSSHQCLATRAMELAATLCWDPQPAVEWQILDGLRRLISADVSSFNRIRLRPTTTMEPVSDPPDLFKADAQDVMHRYITAHPFVRHYLEQPSGAPARRMSDLLPAGQWRAHPLQRQVFEPAGITGLVGIGFRTDPETVEGFSLGRAGGTFSEAERDVLSLLGPHLQVAMHRAATSRGAQLAAPRSQRTEQRPGEATHHHHVRLASGSGNYLSPALTGRQREVLALLCEGLSRTAIAHRLVLSPRTVDKHLDHIYQELGVTDRLAAVRYSQDHGLLAMNTSVIG
jgi:DNA-binding NarL/FixJ family response regulator